MSILWIEEIENYTPIINSEFIYEDLYPSGNICENNNNKTLLDWEEILNSAFDLDDTFIEEFKWC